MSARATAVVPEAALLVEDGGERTLAVADAHVGLEAAMAARGVRMESVGPALEMAGEIAALARRTRAARVVLLGDTKAGTSRISGAEWDAVPAFLSRVAEAAETVVVPGNHDAGMARLLPEGVSMTAPSGIVIGGTLLTHGHVMPSENLSGVARIVMGHAHPVVRDASSVLGGRRVWATMVARREAVFASSRGRLEVTVVPSFNRHTAAMPGARARAARSPILERARRGVVSARLLTLGGAILAEGPSALDGVVW